MKNHTNNNRINSPSQNSGIKPIRHAPNAWSVTQMIAQAPRGMMIRELVQNGIEAARRSATKGNPGRIVFDSTRADASPSCGSSIPVRGWMPLNSRR